MRDKALEVMARGIYARTRSSRQAAEAKALAALTALQASGMTVVPVEPTREMVNAAFDAGDEAGILGPHVCWDAMLAASPYGKAVAKDTTQ